MRIIWRGMNGSVCRGIAARVLGLTTVLVMTAAGQGYINCANYANSDFGTQINNCIAALPSGGGVADARSISGNVTSSVTITDGFKNVELLLGDITLTSSASPAIHMFGASWIQGISVTGTAIRFTGANADCIDWSGSHGGIERLSCSGGTGSGDGLMLASHDRNAIQYNVFDNIQLWGDMDGTNFGIWVGAYSNLDLCSFNQFRDMDVVGFNTGVELTTNGFQGVTDNQFIGGQIRSYQQVPELGTTGLLADNVAISSFVGTEFSGWDVGIHLTGGAHDNHFLGAQAEANNTNYLIDTGATDNHFIAVEAQGFIDHGTRTVLIATNDNAGENGATISQFPIMMKGMTMLDRFDLTNDQGTPEITATGTGVGVGTTSPKASFDSEVNDSNSASASTGLVCGHSLEGQSTSIQAGFGCKISFQPEDIGGAQVERGSIADIWNDPNNTRDSLVFSTANSPGAVRMNELGNGTVGLQLNGDYNFTHTPRSSWTVFLPGALDHIWTAGTTIFPEPITIESISLSFKTLGQNCQGLPNLSLVQGDPLWTGTPSETGGEWSQLNLPIAAAQTLYLMVSQGAGSCTVTPSDANVTIVYRPQ